MRSIFLVSTALLASGCATSQSHDASPTRAAGGPWPFPPPTWSAQKSLSAERDAELNTGPSVVIETTVLRWPAEAAADIDQALTLEGLSAGKSSTLANERAAALTRAARAGGAATVLDPRFVLWSRRSATMQIGHHVRLGRPVLIAEHGAGQREGASRPLHRRDHRLRLQPALQRKDR